jgi:hypothetical protein
MRLLLNLTVTPFVSLMNLKPIQARKFAAVDLQRPWHMHSDTPQAQHLSRSALSSLLERRQAMHAVVEPVLGPCM